MINDPTHVERINDVALVDTPGFQRFPTMLGQSARVRAKAEFFSKNASVAEAISKLFRDDRHPVSAQRARNILRWADDPNLVRKWQPVFVPHMQTAVLRRLLASPPP